MKLRLVAIIAVAASLFAVGCSSGPASPSASTASVTIPQLTVGVPFSLSSLDMTKDGLAGDVTVLSLETLLTIGPQGQLEPTLATSWAQTSPVTYVYHLRRGVKFWNGDELTSADVVYSYNYWNAPGSQDAYTITALKKISAAGPYTVVVTLKQPDASWRFDPALSTTPIFDMKFAEAHKGTFGSAGTLIMGTGPWEVDSFDPTTGVQLSANPHWWGGKVPIQRISVKFYSSETSVALAFRAGEVDVDPDIENPQSFAATSGSKLLATPGCAGALFTMNTQMAPWSNVDVRRAVAYALNRADIITADGGYAQPNYTLIEPQQLRTIASQAQVTALVNSLPLYQYNVAKAKQLMSETPYRNGVNATIVDAAGANGAQDAPGQVIRAELGKIGINVQLKEVSFTAWSADMTGEAGPRPADFTGITCQTPDPSWYTFFLGSWNDTPGEWNMAAYAPSVVNSLIDEGNAATKPASRFAVYSELSRNLATNEPYVPLFTSDLTFGLSSKFSAPGFSYWPFYEGDWALFIRPKP
jgi:peptide/nickel transport system substrate-binding protein